MSGVSGPRTRPKNSAQELVLCVLFFRLVMCDVWCIRPKNSAQELGPRTGVSGPRTRPKNFSVFFSFGTHGETGQKQVRNRSETGQKRVRNGSETGQKRVRNESETGQKRPKNSAQELLLCVLFFRHTWCDEPNRSETGQKRVRNRSETGQKRVRNGSETGQKRVRNREHCLTAESMTAQSQWTTRTQRLSGSSKNTLVLT